MMGDMEKHIGEWWFSDQGKHFQGTLYVDSQNRSLTLILKDISSEDNEVLKDSICNKEVERIAGKLMSGEQVTLCMCVDRCLYKQSADGRKSVTHFISVKYCFRRMECDYSRPFLFYGATFDLGNMVGWAEFRGIPDEVFEVDHKDDTFVGMDASLAGMRIVFHARRTREFDAFRLPKKKIVEDFLLLTIQFDHPVPWGDIRNSLNKILKVISFAVKGTVTYEKGLAYQTLEAVKAGVRERKARLMDGIMFGDNSPLRTETFPITRYLFFLGGFVYVLRNGLLEKLSRIEPVLELFLSIYRLTENDVRLKFLTLTQVAESFHARIYGNKISDMRHRLESYFSDSGDERRKEVENEIFEKPVPKSDKEKWVERLFGRSDSRVTLQSRIWELYFANGVPSLFCCDAKEKMLEKLPRIGITRNYYTHWDERLLAQVIAEEDLDRVNAVLIRILQYHFMRYIGFPFKATVGPIIFTMSDHDLVNHINLYEKFDLD